MIDRWQSHGHFYRFGWMLYLPTYLTNLLIYKFTTYLTVSALTHTFPNIFYSSVYIWLGYMPFIFVAWWKCRIPSNVKPSLHWSWQLSAAYMIVRAVVLNSNVKFGARMVVVWGKVGVRWVPSLRVRQLGHYIAISKGESDTWTGLIKTTHGAWSPVFRPSNGKSLILITHFATSV